MSQLEPLFLDFGDSDISVENPRYLNKQLVTYIGNKRSLAKHLNVAISKVRERLDGRRITAVDLFAGTGFVSRLLRQHSTLVVANDLELYSAVVNRCYLSDRDSVNWQAVAAIVDELNSRADAGESVQGFFQEMYAPKDDRNIQDRERVFYTTDNARRLDLFASGLSSVAEPLRSLVMGPLLSRASMHANTSGVFKGFYKDKETGIGKFGGAAADALARILEPIRLEMPELSSYGGDSLIHQRDANELVRELPEVDLAYLDPPYNQHPYGSNYFMLNLIADYRRPMAVSDVSGIPTDWNRSGYNVRQRASDLVEDLVRNTPARFLLISFNDEGFVDPSALRDVLSSEGQLEEIVVPYNTFRGSRNLRERSIHVNEHLFLLDRS